MCCPISESSIPTKIQAKCMHFRQSSTYVNCNICVFAKVVFPFCQLYLGKVDIFVIREVTNDCRVVSSMMVCYLEKMVFLPT